MKKEHGAEEIEDAKDDLKKRGIFVPDIDMKVHAKELVEKGELQGAEQKAVNEIKNARNAEDWDDLDTITREIIVLSYGSEKYPSHNMYLTPADMPSKTHCRLTILHAIQDNYIGTA